MIPTTAPRELRIRTPNGVEFVMPLAGVGFRFVAWCIDAAFAVMLSVALGMALSAFAALSPVLAQSLSMLAFFALQTGYGMAFELLWRGQTPGKRALGLRVVDAQGLRLTPSQVILRNLLRPIDSLPLAYLVGGIAALVSKHGQRLGDLAAGTVVTHVRRALPPAYSALVDTGPNSLRALPHLAARLRQRVPPHEAAAALEALLRRDQLEPAARLSLFHSIADHFRQRVPFPPATVEGLTDEAYVRAVVDVLHRPGPESSLRRESSPTAAEVETSPS